MRLKVPFLSYVLAVAGFVLPSVILAAFLPSLINTQPVKARLLSELNEWTGGQVKIAGKVAVESFFSLSLSVEDVRIERFKSFPRLKGLRASEIIARISWFDLLLGNLDFDKLKINGAVIKAQVSNPRDTAASLLSVLSGPHDSPFAAFVLTDTVVALRDTPGRPYRKVHVESAIAKLDPASGRVETSGRFQWSDEKVEFDVRTRSMSADNVTARVPLRIKLKSATFAGEFDGNVSVAAPWWAEGQINAETPDILRLANRLGWNISGAAAQAISASGAFSLFDQRLSLEAAEISIGTHSASGNLALTLRRQLPRLQGSLAFDEIDLDGAEANLAHGQGDTQSLLALSEMLSEHVDLDLLVSARQMSAGNLQVGAAAFALNSEAGRISADIAELSVFDGSMRGHLELNFNTAPVSVRARLSGDDLRAGELLRWTDHQDWVRGQANANAVLDAEWNDEAQRFILTSADARISFPEGGYTKFNIPLLAAETSPANIGKGWEQAVSTTAAFEALRFKLTLRNKMLHCANLTLVSEDHLVSGDGQIDFAKQSLDWRFTVVPATNVSQAMQTAQKLGISLQGPWAKPIIRSVKLSDGDLTEFDPKSALAVDAKESIADVR